MVNFDLLKKNHDTWLWTNTLMAINSKFKVNNALVGDRRGV